ncbi:RING-type E3 ubiquitin transferase [Abeliophyllum distichum]|uniref:RING-type E3 ubiquitin transferase n=1 Tax=Abeliophyllum distichum TaxID=126358 RepID=A0ABD1SZH9_9LAMI
MGSSALMKMKITTGVPILVMAISLAPVVNVSHLLQSPKNLCFLHRVLDRAMERGRHRRRKLPKNAPTFFTNLALEDENKTAIGVLGALPPLLHALRLGHGTTRTDVAMALCHLTLVQSNRAKIIKLGAVGTLLGLLKDPAVVARVLPRKQKFNQRRVGRYYVQTLRLLKLITIVMLLVLCLLWTPRMIVPTNISLDLMMICSVNSRSQEQTDDAKLDKFKPGSVFPSVKCISSPEDTSYGKEHGNYTFLKSSCNDETISMVSELDKSTIKRPPSSAIADDDGLFF